MAQATMKFDKKGKQRLTISKKPNLQAKWHRCQPKWQKRFPWLRCRTDAAGNAWLGCEACFKLANGASGKSKWADFEIQNLPSIQATLFHRHTKSRFHLEAVGEADGGIAPPLADFEQTLYNIQSGRGSTKICLPKPAHNAPETEILLG